MHNNTNNLIKIQRKNITHRFQTQFYLGKVSKIG